MFRGCVIKLHHWWHDCNLQLLNRIFTIELLVHSLRWHFGLILIDRTRVTKTCVSSKCTTYLVLLPLYPMNLYLGELKSGNHTIHWAPFKTWLCYFIQLYQTAQYLNHIFNSLLRRPWSNLPICKGLKRI